MQLDPLLPDAHAATGLLHDFHRDWERATAAFSRAIEMRPDDAQVRAWYAISLARRGLFDDAVSEARRAHMQQPLSLPIHAQVGWILFWQGRTELAIDEWRKALDTDPNFPLAHYNLGLGYTRLGLYRRAIAEFDRALALVPDRLPYITQLAQAHARAGNRLKAQRLLNAVEERATRERVSGYQLAIVYAALGEKDTAIHELERAEHEQIRSLPIFASSPSGLRRSQMIRDSRL